MQGQPATVGKRYGDWVCVESFRSGPGHAAIVSCTSCFRRKRVMAHIVLLGQVRPCICRTQTPKEEED